MQDKYSNIIRVNYNLKSEYVVTKDRKAELEKRWYSVTKQHTILKDFEASKISDRVQNAGKTSYVERNQDMINDSDYYIFFYISNYKPETTPRYASSGKSGTRLAYDYAVNKKKTIINIANS